MRWAGANAAALGGIPGQLLLAPALDSDMTRPSCTENGEGYLLTSALMRWFWDHSASVPARHVRARGHTHTFFFAW